MKNMESKVPTISCEIVRNVLGYESYKRLCVGTFRFDAPSNIPGRRIFWDSIPDQLKKKFSQELQMGMCMQTFDTIQKGYRNHRTEKPSEASLEAEVQDQLQSLSETFDRTRCPLFGLSLQYRFGIEELSRIFGVLQSEEEARLDGSSISSDNVENSIARCISQCLSDYPERKRSIHRILSLLKDYKVVTPLRDGSPSVSLQKIHVILQDNFECSSFCMLLNILLAGHMGVTTKTIDF